MVFGEMTRGKTVKLGGFAILPLKERRLQCGQNCVNTNVFEGACEGNTGIKWFWLRRTKTILNITLLRVVSLNLSVFVVFLSPQVQQTR